MFLLILTIIGLILTIILIPKRISTLEMYITSIFATFLATFVDVYLDFKFDFYGFFDKGVSWEYIPIILVVYPAINILFLNFYPDHKPFISKSLYILGFTILSIIFEYIALHTSVLYYNEWKLWYSAFCYPFLYITLRLNSLLIRKGFKKG